MGWMETCAVDERMRFVMAIEGQEEAFAAVCRRFGVSRKTGYKWLGRYREAGGQGLTDWARAPLEPPPAGAPGNAEPCFGGRRGPPHLGGGTEGGLAPTGGGCLPRAGRAGCRSCPSR